MRKTAVKLLCLLVVCLLFFSSCSQEAVCTISKIDGLYYINFADGNDPGPGGALSSVGNTISFENVAEMKETFLGEEEINDHKRAALCLFFYLTEGKGIHFFNMEELLVPVLPQGFSEQPSNVRMECEASSIVYYEICHTLVDDENVTAKVAFYHSMKDWNLRMERIFTGYLSSFGEGKGTSYEREGAIKRFTIHDESNSLQYLTHKTLGSTRYIMEYAKDGITSVTMFVLEGETFFSVRISGLTELPSIEYLQSFSAKVYED